MNDDSMGTVCTATTLVDDGGADEVALELLEVAFSADVRYRLFVSPLRWTLVVFVSPSTSLSWLLTVSSSSSASFPFTDSCSITLLFSKRPSMFAPSLVGLSVFSFL